MAQFSFRDVKNIYINGNKVDSFVLNGARVWPAPLSPVIERCSLSKELNKFYLTYEIFNPNAYSVRLQYCDGDPLGHYSPWTYYSKTIAAESRETLILEAHLGRNQHLFRFINSGGISTETYKSVTLVHINYQKDSYVKFFSEYKEYAISGDPFTVTADMENEYIVNSWELSNGLTKISQGYNSITVQVGIGTSSEQYITVTSKKLTCTNCSGNLASIPCNTQAAYNPCATCSTSASNSCGVTCTSSAMVRPCNTCAASLSAPCLLCKSSSSSKSVGSETERVDDGEELYDLEENL